MTDFKFFIKNVRVDIIYRGDAPIPSEKFYTGKVDLEYELEFECRRWGVKYINCNILTPAFTIVTEEFDEAIDDYIDVEHKFNMQDGEVHLDYLRKVELCIDSINIEVLENGKFEMSLCI